jgi:hypothetical protein
VKHSDQVLQASSVYSQPLLVYTEAQQLTHPGPMSQDIAALGPTSAPPSTSCEQSSGVRLQVRPFTRWARASDCAADDDDVVAGLSGAATAWTGQELAAQADRDVPPDGSNVARVLFGPGKRVPLTEGEAISLGPHQVGGRRRPSTAPAQQPSSDSVSVWLGQSNFVLVRILSFGREHRDRRRYETDTRHESILEVLRVSSLVLRQDRVELTGAGRFCSAAVIDAPPTHYANCPRSTRRGNGAQHDRYPTLLGRLKLREYFACSLLIPVLFCREGWWFNGCQRFP